MANTGAIRKYYEKRLAPICSSSRARRDVLALLDDRKSISRAAEALMVAAMPYSGDPVLKGAIDGFRAVIEGRTKTKA